MQEEVGFGYSSFNTLLTFFTLEDSFVGSEVAVISHFMENQIL